MQYIIQIYGDQVCWHDWHVEGVFDFCRFYYVKGGEAVYTDAGGTFRLNRGSLYVFPCNVYYKIVHNPDDPFDALWMHVNLFTNHAARPVEIPVREDSLQYHLMRGLTHAVKLSASMVEKLFAALYDSIGGSLNQRPHELTEVRRVFDYINANAGRGCTNRQLAGLLGYSEKYFNRLFLKNTGIQPHRYAMTVRMGYAAKYLIEGRSVKETAGLLGYASANNFSRDFKAHYSRSPREYSANYSYRP